jgi:hypothetical protein
VVLVKELVCVPVQVGWGPCCCCAAALADRCGGAAGQHVTSSPDNQSIKDSEDFVGKVDHCHFIIKQGH